MANDAGKILLIEDDGEVRTVLVELLESRGYEVEIALDGIEGMEKLKNVRVDAIILDLLIQRMHGYEVIQKLRASHKHRRTPIIVISGKAYAPDQRKALEMGASAFLAKPVRAEQLSCVLHELLDSVHVRFWGVRGSIATPGRDTVRYGGNTPCVSIEWGRESLILDCGTGARQLGVTLMAEAAGLPLSIRMLITHTHWDHIQGFPFFVPAFIPGNKVEVYGPPSIDKPLEKVLKGQMDPEYFPVALGEMAADISVHEIRDRKFEMPPFSISSTYVNHPGVTMAYRIVVDGVVIVYATDTEPYRTLLGEAPGADAAAAGYAEGRDAELIEFIRDADLYIADSQYTVEDYAKKRGWGHTAYPDAVALATAAGAKRIALFSHDPMHDDDMIDRKVEHCREIVAASGASLEVLAAIEGEAITIPSERVLAVIAAEQAAKLLRDAEQQQTGS